MVLPVLVEKKSPDYSHGDRLCKRCRLAYQAPPDAGLNGITMADDHPLLPLLERIARALEHGHPPTVDIDLGAADAFVWQAETGRLKSVASVRAVELDLLQGIDHVRDLLVANTERFARGLPANNALLWGARGMGKSSLVKAVHAGVNRRTPGALALIELHREDLETLPALLDALRRQPKRSIIFCDDLSFDAGETSYKSLKAVLEGGLEGKPDNVLFYATSNRRHLMPRDMIENERSSAINPSEAVEEKVSLSDRFGLWLGFHPCTQDEYLAMIRGYCDAYGVQIDDATLRAEAIEWQATRGARSGRVAWQYFTDLAGRHGARIAP
jgi:predicted AAA+ superfamily ATPase